jgi:hypothetical protein
VNLCRESFEELVLNEEGKVRWNRVENLVLESSKSAGFDPGQLWMVLDWILGELGAGIRKPLAAEIARLVDSAVAGARQRVYGHGPVIQYTEASPPKTLVFWLTALASLHRCFGGSCDGAIQNFHNLCCCAEEVWQRCTAQGNWTVSVLPSGQPHELVSQTS